MDKFTFSEISELIKHLALNKVKTFKFLGMDVEFYQNGNEVEKVLPPISPEMEKEIEEVADNDKKALLEKEIKRELSELYYEDPAAYEEATLEGIIVKEEIKESVEGQE
jgi:hypothetical protein